MTVLLGLSAVFIGAIVYQKCKNVLCSVLTTTALLLIYYI
jgi:hypothetical protein